MVYRIFAGLLSLTLLVGGMGCNNSNTAAAVAPRIVFITNSDSAFWDAAEKGWLDAGKELGIEAEFRRNREGSTQSQVRLLDQVNAQRNVRGVAISVVEAGAPGIIERLRSLSKKGIPVVTVDSDVEATHADVRLAYVGTNNFEAGKIAGAVAQMLAPEGGKVAGFVATTEADNARLRIDGFKAGAGDKFSLVEVFTDGTDRAKARQNVTAAIIKYKDLLMPFGVYSYNAPAIAEAVKESGKRDSFKILTFDAEEQTLAAVEAGLIDATVVQNTYDMGFKSASYIAQLVKGNASDAEKIIPKDVKQLDTGVQVIVPNNSVLKGKQPYIQTREDLDAFLKAKGIKST